MPRTQHPLSLSLTKLSNELGHRIELARSRRDLSASLFARFSSRQENSPTMQMVSALRGQFGGHAVLQKD